MIRSDRDVKPSTSVDKMFKIAVFLGMILVCRFASSFVVVESKIDSSELSEARTVDKSFKILYDLYKIFNSFQKKHGFKIPPLDGVLYRNPNQIVNPNRRVHPIDHFPTLAELNKEEEQMMGMKPPKKVQDMKEITTTDEPFFWPFDKFSKKMDLVLMTKILLKLIILKKIVKFIALICLLFFIPTIKDTDEKESEEKESRHFLQTYGKRESSKI